MAPSSVARADTCACTHPYSAHVASALPTSSPNFALQCSAAAASIHQQNGICLIALTSAKQHMSFLAFLAFIYLCGSLISHLFLRQTRQDQIRFSGLEKVKKGAKTGNKDTGTRQHNSLSPQQPALNLNVTMPVASRDCQCHGQHPEFLHRRRRLRLPPSSNAKLVLAYY